MEKEVKRMERKKLSVHTVVDLVLRCGDIDNRYSEESSMQLGAAAHRKLQKQMGEEYQKEVSLQLETQAGEIPILLQGRADGVFWEDSEVVIDEIKTTVLPLEKLSHQQQLHLGQAKCYAYMYLRQMEPSPSQIAIQLTYYQLETDELQRQRFICTREELETFFNDLMDRYSVWMSYEERWRQIRNRSIRETPFPFPAYRPGQRELAVAVYRTIQREKKLYVQAPTGIGKTLSTLFPSIKAMGEQYLDKLFYLTAKTVTRTVAEEAVGLLHQKGLRLKSLTLRAKDKICPCEITDCNPDACPFAKGHFDRINDALLDILENNDLITPGVVGAYAEKHRVCPHEFGLDIARWADLVVGDYNHVFDPVVYLRRFFDNMEEDRYLFLIDEAHNLADRVRDMYTAAVHKSQFSALYRELKDKNKLAAALRKSLRQVNRYLLDLGKELQSDDFLRAEPSGIPKGAGRQHRVEPEQDKVLSALVQLFTQAASDWMAERENRGHPLYPQLLELFFDASAFLNIGELFDSHYTTILERSSGEVVYTLYCLDPSAIIADRLTRGKSAVLFSATLTPLDYYRDILGGAEGDGTLALPSPFDSKKLLLAAHVGISTKYADRPESYSPIADSIYLATSQKRGNYLAFFPSYDYMHQVYQLFAQRYPQVDTLLQANAMSEEERTEFLQRFDSDNRQTLVGFCVLGGIFSEGIDLKGERLIGSIIVGVGLPKLSLRQDLIKAYFNDKNGQGYNYAYLYPGMNKVLQAAGRVIRSESDYGIVLLLDSRFGTPQYRSLCPPHWSGMRLLRSSAALEQLVEEFPYFK